MENATNSRHNPAQFDLLALRKILEANHRYILSVVTDSMEPLIKVGEDITIERVNKTELSTFDIIVFDQAGKLNAHFLTHIDLEKDQFLTRSLKNPHTNDYPIKWEQILGRVSTKKLNWILKLKVLWAEIRS